LRGNVNHALKKKLSDSDWSGPVFAAAGPESNSPQKIILIRLDDSTPAQGAMLVVAMANDEYLDWALHEPRY
jgi:hydroxymethylbilane synthase